MTSKPDIRNSVLPIKLLFTLFRSMTTTEKEEGDELAKYLIQTYWNTFTSGAYSWLYYNWPLHFTQIDKWATHEKWVEISRKVLEKDTRIPFALGIMLDEGYTEYLDTAMDVVATCDSEWEKFQRNIEEGDYSPKYRPLDPECLFDLVKHFPQDHPMRRGYLPPDDPDVLLEDARRALISVEDKEFCRNQAAYIERVFTAPIFDAGQAEEYALPRMAELGRLCSKYIDPVVMSSAKQFCLEYLQKDREIGTNFRQLLEHLADDSPRILWIRDRIAPFAWRVGWLDIVTSLKDEQWYWNSDIWNLGGKYDISYIDGDNLLVWSQYVENDLLRERALHMMLGEQYKQMTGAIAWVRMSDVRWPPD